MNQKTMEYRKKVAESFIKSLEENQLDWKKSWAGENMLPESVLSGKPYKGCNKLYLSLVCQEKGYTDPRFATFNQIVDNGWRLQKGSKGYQVEYWMPYDYQEKKAITWEEYSKLKGQPEQNVGITARYYTVFNAADIVGIPERKLPQKHDVAVDDLIPKISKNMGVEILHDGGDRAFYRVLEDKIHMPKPEYFQDDYSYNSVALHELSHATGAENRLKRDLKNNFGTNNYAYEELVAEISSAFMSQDLSVEINDYHMDNHKAYVQSWIQKIREKPDTLFAAIRDAEKAADYLEYQAELVSEAEYKKTLGKSMNVPVKDIKEEPEKKQVENEKEIVNEKQDLEKAKNVSGEEQKRTPQEYVGFSKAQGAEKPTLVYGNSQEEVLNKLQNWNKTRDPENQYTLCNIGKLNPDTGKHENYRKFDVATGKDISNIYLNLPRMGKEEFLQVTAELKANGAKYNPSKKQWYITADADLSKFEKYLPGQNENQEKTELSSEQKAFMEAMKEISEDAEQIDNAQYWAEDVPYYSADTEIRIELENQKGSFSIKASDLEQFKGQDYLNAVDDKVREYLKNESFAVDMPDMMEGEKIKFYIPTYKEEGGLLNRSGIQEIKGTLKEVSYSEQGITYTVEKEDGQTVQINSEDIYTNSQAEVLKKAMEQGVEPGKFEMISNIKFSAAQMDEIRKGFGQGLNEEQVFNYAKPGYDAGDMELYRYGQLHGLKPERIEEIIEINDVKSVSTANWKEKKGELDKEIYAKRCTLAKGIKKQGFNPNLNLVKNIEKLNHLTKRENSLKDISEAYKSKSFGDKPQCQDLVNKIGDELKMQEMMKNVPCK